MTPKNEIVMTPKAAQISNPQVSQILYHLLTTEKPEKMLGKILDASVDVIKADAGTIVLWESEMGFYNTLANIDPEIPLMGTIMSPDSDRGGLDARLYRERERKYIALSNYSKNMDANPILKPAGYHFAVGIPLYVHQTELIGTACFYYNDRTEKISAEEVTILEELGKSISVAILTAQLHQQLAESKQKEEESRNFLDLLVNASPDLIINIDLTGKIKFWNQAAERSTGFSAGEMMDKKLPLIEGKVEEDFYQLLQKSRNGDVFLDQEVSFFSKTMKNKKDDSKGKKLRLSIVPIKNHRNSIDSVLLTGKDVSEKQFLEHKVQQYNAELTQKALDLTQKERLLHQTQDSLLNAEKLAMIGVLTDKLNHQINNPLMGMLATLSIIQEDTSDLLSHPEESLLSHQGDTIAEISSQITEIIQEGRRIKDVLGELRIFSSVAKEIHFRKTNFMDVIMQNFADIKPKAKKHHVNLSITKKISQAYIFGNFAQLQELFFRIFDNAFLAIASCQSPSSGELSLHVDQLVLNRQPFVKVRISDNGIGMTSDQIPRLFEPFYTEWEGEPINHIGLSLAIVHTILQSHNGHIAVESHTTKSKGKKKPGTTIILEFPMI